MNAVALQECGPTWKVHLERAALHLPVVDGGWEQPALPPELEAEERVCSYICSYVWSYVFSYICSYGS